MNTKLILKIIFTCILLATNKIPEKAIKAKCIYVFDGDTILVVIKNRKEKVRLLGINTPEVRNKYRTEEPFGKEASSFTKNMILNKNVLISYKPNHRDKYNRLLAYVYTDNGDFLNKELLKKGLAKAYRFFDYNKKNEFLKVEKKAKKKCLGLWEWFCNKK